MDRNSHFIYGFASSRSDYMICANFDPWTGKYLMTSYTISCEMIKSHYSSFLQDGQNTMQDAIRSILIEARRNMHNGGDVCDLLYETTSGYDKGMTRLAYIPTIRTYAFFRKNEKGVFDALDYCPFCGAKLPERLDDKLTEILQAECGLHSWRDYKKASHEFHTNEWWVKRGL